MFVLRYGFYYFIGDTKGNDMWLGQYPGNQEEVQQPCQDCKCMFDDLKETNSTCVYIMLQDVHKGKRRKQKCQGWWNIIFQVHVKI